MILEEGGEGVDGEGVGLDGAAVEDGPADVEEALGGRGARQLGGEDELRHRRGHVHLVPRRDQVPHHLDGAGGVAEAVAGEVEGEDEAAVRRRRRVGGVSGGWHGVVAEGKEAFGSEREEKWMGSRSVGGCAFLLSFWRDACFNCHHSDYSPLITVHSPCLSLSLSPIIRTPRFILNSVIDYYA
jgi:hypothetical protein